MLGEHNTEWKNKGNLSLHFYELQKMLIRQVNDVLP